MTAPKVATLKRGGSRFYIHPNSKTKVPGVTSVVGMLPKDFLKWWAAKLVAETAVDNIGTVVQMAISGDRQGAVDYLKRAPQRNTGEAGDTGTEVHGLCEDIALGRGGRVHPDLKPYVQGFKDFVEEFKPEFLEVESTVWSDTHGYAGSFDYLAKIGDEVVLIDVKTTRSGVHEEVALQLAAYANADYILRPDGEQVPIPQIDGAAVLHLRPEGWSLVPIAISPQTFGIFQALLQVFKWDAELKRGVIGQPIGGRKFDEAV